MVEITFQNIEDAQRLFERLHQKVPSSHKNVRLLAREDHYIIKFSTNELEVAKKVFRQFILNEKRDDWLQTIISQMFYFTDVGEQQQIIDIVHSLLDGNRDELLPLIRDVEVEENITATIEDVFVKHTTFSFDSFIKFRLRSLMSNLEKYVEVAIDEYKMEQEYQMFIQMLREFIQDRIAIINELHILLTDSILFYDSFLREIKREELTKLIDRKLLANHPVYIDSVTIAPLLSIAPQVIYIYTDEREHPLVRTIENIFEERVVTYSSNEFFVKKAQLNKL